MTARHPIAERLRAFRLAAGYESVSEAARKIGIPIQTAIAHEGSGASFRRPKLDALRKYAKGYGTTLEALTGE